VHVLIYSCIANLFFYSYSLIPLELFDVDESILCSHVIFIQFCEFLLSLVSIRDSFHLCLC
jgi:hypothetical protein